jgi:hypothetical protein
MDEKDFFSRVTNHFPSSIFFPSEPFGVAWCAAFAGLLAMTSVF